MRPSSVCIPVANTTASASPPVQTVPLNTRSRACRNGDVGVGQLRRAEHRKRLTRQRRRVQLEGTGEQSSVGRDAVALGDEQHITRHQRPSLDLPALTVAQHGGLRRQVRRERLDGPLRLLLLDEREASR